MSYSNIYQYYKTSRILKKENYDIFEQENMIPYERDVLMIMIEQEIKERLKNEARYTA